MPRPKGSPNKATATKEAYYAKQGILPLDFMLKTLRDDTQPHEERMKAAINAAPYVHPKLATVQHKGDEDSPLAIALVERRIVKADNRDG